MSSEFRHSGGFELNKWCLYLRPCLLIGAIRECIANHYQNRPDGSGLNTVRLSPPAPKFWGSQIRSSPPELGDLGGERNKLED